MGAEKQYFLDFIMQIFNQDQSIKMNDVVNRLMQHHNPKNYLCKQNLLYLPDVKIDQGDHVIDVLPLQLGIKIDDQIRETIQKDTHCSFNDYVTQLCNTYAENEVARANFNPYKFWILTQQSLAKVQLSSQKVNLKLFTKLNCINEYVIKRNMLTGCDVIDQKIIYFEQDPTTMLSIQDPLNYRDYLNKYIDSNDQNAIQQYSQSVERLQKEIYELSKRYNLNIEKTVQEIATFGFGIGSSPAEVLCNYQKYNSLEKYVIIGKIIQLFAACRMTKSAFPWQFKGYTDDQSINYTYFHMENIRLIQCKLMQKDYFVWLTRIQKISKEMQDEDSLKMIEQYHKNYLFKLAYKSKPNEEQTLQFEQMKKTYEEIDQENLQIMQIDLIFCQFIPPSSIYYDKVKQYPLPIFSINDCNSSTFRQAWLVSAAYKVLFLTIFGQRYELVDEACKQKGFPASFMDDIRKLYFDILNLWSRHYDYLLMFLQTLTLATVKELIAEFKYRKALDTMITCQCSYKQTQENNSTQYKYSTRRMFINQIGFKGNQQFLNQEELLRILTQFRTTHQSCCQIQISHNSLKNLFQTTHQTRSQEGVSSFVKNQVLKRLQTLQIRWFYNKTQLFLKHQDAIQLFPICLLTLQQNKQTKDYVWPLKRLELSANLQQTRLSNNILMNSLTIHQKGQKLQVLTNII
ncbi:Conserved_hypothetical protein [Hexamita inflata]|uniref:Uncharacterized protein n=1 Tax=Hexamita inflata TaxID=28002 RepID=A0AA86RNY2_9EUKA|nr:Conserved hypothetical protein [Hexamita inflata]